MAEPLVASLVLKLQDQLSGGLGKLQEQLEKLANVGRGIGLGGLEKAGEVLSKTRQLAGGLAEQLELCFDAGEKLSLNGLASADGVLAETTSEAGGLAEQLTRIQRLAGSAGQAMRQMASAGVHGFQELKQAGANVVGAVKNFGEAGSHLINKGFGAAVEGFAVYEPIKAYAERDKELRQQGIMEGLQGPALEAEIRRLNTMVNKDALANAVSSESVVEARKDILGQGITRALTDAALKTHTEAGKAYGISPELLGPVTGALIGNMKIAANEQDLGGALAAIAKADQTGRFKMADFSHALPGISGVAASLGMTGRGALNEIAAGLEISTRTATDPTQAGVNFQDLLGYITSNREDNLSRKKLGLDMPALLRKAQAHGTNPLDAYIGEIMKLTAGKSPLEQAQEISKIVTNQQARLALLAIVQNHSEFVGRQKELGAVGGDKLQTDLKSSMAGWDTQVQKLNETMVQLNLTLGQAFAPLLGVIVTALGWLNEKLTWLNTNFPKTTSWVLGGVAAMLLLAAGLGLVVSAWGVLAAGFGVMASVIGFVVAPVRLLGTALRFLVFLIASLTGLSVGVVAAIAAIAAVFVAAAYDIYENWSRFSGFFAEMWNGVKQVFQGFVTFVAGVFTGNLKGAFGGLKTMGAGLFAIFDGVWKVVKTVFLDFGLWIDKWSGGFAGRILAGIAANWSTLVSGLHDRIGGLVSAFDNSKIGRLLGLADKKSGRAPEPANDNVKGAAAGAAPANGRVDVHIQAAPGTAVTAAQASGAAAVHAPITAPARGSTVGRP